MSTEGNVLWRVDKWYPDLPAPVQELLKTYHSELIKYNAKLNLIGRQTERDADEQHFADCISACLLVLKDIGSVKVIHDLGSGNGLPGVILAILALHMTPQLKVILVDSDERKGEFLKHIVHNLKLKNAEVFVGRVEDLKGPLEAAVNRGFASISKVCLLCKDTFAPGSTIFHMKGSNWVREVGEMPSQLMAFWAPQLTGEYTLPVSQAKRAVVASKKLK